MKSMEPRLDYDALKKGEVISQERIEKIYNVHCMKEPEAYRLKMLDLREQIHIHRHDLYVRCEGRTLLVMTDSEAAKHRWRETHKMVRGLSTLSDNGARIDASEFDEVEKKVLEQQDMFLAAQSLVLRRQLNHARSEVRLLRGANESEEVEED